ncbi:MAG: class I SAM-dependent methyltransferase [Eubacteriales bacterium]|nr:class I SAM-dependent methyltransferase [Eubacteriales bacterium]
MAILQGLEWTFDTAAEQYERLRPGYVDELYRMLFDYRPIGGTSRVLEIGIGGGQATLPVLRTGCELTAVEYGAHFSELCRKKFADYPKFSVITGRFEDTDFEENTYDLIFSASAFHWVPEETGYPKVFSLLKSGGAFARFANHPNRGQDNPALSEALDEVYAAYYYRYYDRKPQTPAAFGEEQARDRARIAEKYGFTDIRYALFYRTRTFSPAEYRALLGTYSDHIAIAEPVRTAFFEKVEEAIEAHGGSITIHDTIGLQLARKPLNTGASSAALRT